MSLLFLLPAGNSLVWLLLRSTALLTTILLESAAPSLKREDRNASDRQPASPASPGIRA